jgi:hypothetical protein
MWIKRCRWPTRSGARTAVAGSLAWARQVRADAEAARLRAVRCRTRATAAALSVIARIHAIRAATRRAGTPSGRPPAFKSATPAAQAGSPAGHIRPQARCRPPAPDDPRAASWPFPAMPSPARGSRQGPRSQARFPPLWLSSNCAACSNCGGRSPFGGLMLGPWTSPPTCSSVPIVIGAWPPASPMKKPVWRCSI